MFCQKGLHKSCRMGRCIVVMKLICSLDHCECDGHTVHKLSQRRLTAYWLAPRESDCSQMCSKVSSDWLPSYITATRPVLEILKMAGYFPDSPRIWLRFVQVLNSDRLSVSGLQLESSVTPSPAVAYREGDLGCSNTPSPEFPKAQQNHAKRNRIVKTVKNCWI